MPQATLLTGLSTAFAFANGIVVDAHTCDAEGQFTKSPDVRAFMTEAAVLKLFIAWERFLEQSFLNYLMGAPSITGATVTRYLAPTSMHHAHQVLVGTQRYVDWGNPAVVKRLSQLYFDAGHPYETALAAVQSDLSDLRAIRNAAAHLSTSTSDQVDKVALRRLGRPVVGITVYDLVTAAGPHGGDTILQGYQNLLVATATLIAQA